MQVVATGWFVYVLTGKPLGLAWWAVSVPASRAADALAGAWPIDSIDAGSLACARSCCGWPVQCWLSAAGMDG